jgi:hypothetical protein
MTLQVGMVGTDGIVLASDTRWVATQEMWQTTNSTKITISHERGMAIACARNMEVSVTIARAIIADLKNEECDDPCIPIEKIATRFLSQSSEDRRDPECLIVLAKAEPRLFTLRVGTICGRLAPLCVREDKKAVAGDHGNAAVFFVQRYYSRKPMCDLLPLAAQLVIGGGKLNPYGIDGLEILLCEASGFHPVPEESIRQLQARATALDETINSSLSQA